MCLSPDLDRPGTPESRELWQKASRRVRREYGQPEDLHDSRDNAGTVPGQTESVPGSVPHGDDLPWQINDCTRSCRNDVVHNFSTGERYAVHRHVSLSAPLPAFGIGLLPVECYRIALEDLPMAHHSLPTFHDEPMPQTQPVPPYYHPDQNKAAPPGGGMITAQQPQSVLAKLRELLMVLVETGNALDRLDGSVPQPVDDPNGDGILQTLSHLFAVSTSNLERTRRVAELVGQL
jgi:hypothetical protein